MKAKNKEKLLKNKKAVDEINRHRWIESEKAGYDIGFETASLDWLEKFSSAWMQYHMPDRPMSPQDSSKLSSNTTSKNRTKAK